MTSSDILQVPEVNPEGDANLTTGPNVTGVGAGVSAGEFAFDAPDDQTCLRASLEGERRRRSGVKPETATAEPPEGDSESHFPPLGPDDSDECDDDDELTDNITDDDWVSASSQSVSDDEELDDEGLDRARRRTPSCARGR